MRLVADQAQAQVLAYLEPIAQQTDLLAEQASRFDMQDWAGLDLEILPIIETFPNMSMLSFADDEGRFVMLKRGSEGQIDTKKIAAERPQEATWERRRPGSRAVDEVERVANDFDPRERPWFLGAVAQKGQHFWTEAYVFFTDHRPGITVSRVVPGSQPEVVVAADIDIIQFSQDLAALEFTESTEILILDEELRIVASQHPEVLVSETAEGFKLQDVSRSSIPQVQALSRPELARSVRANESSLFHFTAGPKRFLAVSRPIELWPNRSWRVVVLVPEAELLAEVNASNLRGVVLSVALLIIALVLSLYISRIFSRSIRRLAVEAEAVQELDFKPRERQLARFKEIEEVQQAFEGMKTGLRAFQKYLPVELVRVLLAEKIEPELGGEARELTIFFSDIAGFTPISEQLAPLEMSQRLGQYLAALTEEIESRGGTVVQYVGDAIMAFWNAPLPVEDHAFKACQAALACQRRVRQLWTEDEAPIFHTRIGLHGRGWPFWLA